MDGTIYSIGLFLGEISSVMNTYPTRVAYASSILVGVDLISAPIICGLTNKCGFRVITFGGGIIAFAVLLVTSLVTDIFLFLLVFGVIGGLACSCIYVPTAIIVGFYFEKWRALASAVSICGSSCGIIFFPIVLNNIPDEYHWNDKFRFMAALFLLVSALSLTFKSLPSLTVQPDAEREDSILSVDLGGDRGIVLSQMYSNYHNLMYPTTAEIQESNPQPQSVQNVRKNVSSSSTLVAYSGYGGGSSTIISKMSTVFEDEYEITMKQKCGQFCKSLCCMCCTFRNIHPTVSAVSRPMYRDDIFFAGSVYTLPEYSKKPSVKKIVSSVKGTASRKSAIDYHMSVTRVATQKDLHEEAFVCCPEALKRILATMLDFKLLNSPSFICLTISGFLVSLGMYIPFIYIVEKAIEDNIEKDLAGIMVTGLGIANLFGRIFSGVLCSIPRVDALVVTYMGLFIAGIPSILFAFAKKKWTYYVFIALYGSSIATVPSMKTIILVDLLGLDKLTNAFGITLMFQGVSSIISLPLAGYFIDYTGSYHASFIYCGFTAIISGVLLMPIKYIKHWEERKSRRRSTFM